MIATHHNHPRFRHHQPARKFVNGSTQYLQVDQVAITDFPWTMACWFNADTLNTPYGVMFVGDKDAAAKFISMRFNISGSNGKVNQFINKYNGSTNVNVFTTTQFTTGIWNHACTLSRSSTSHEAYVNGGGKGTDSTSPGAAITGHDRTSIGMLRDSTPALPYDGRMFWPFFWSIDLLEEQVKKLARGFQPWKMEPRYITSGLDFQSFNDPYLESTWTNTGTTLAEPRRFAQGTHRKIAVPQPAVVGGRIMSSLSGDGGLAGMGGIAGKGGGLAA